MVTSSKTLMSIHKRQLWVSILVPVSIHQSSCNENSLNALIKTLIKRIIIFIIILLLFLVAYPAKAESPKIEVIKQYPDHITEQKQYAYDMVLKEWSVEEWKYFDDLIHRESRWNNHAQNPNSTAYGYGQFLNSTWKLVGCEKTSNPNTQIDCTIKYIKAIYGTPQKAIVFHNANNFY